MQRVPELCSDEFSGIYLERVLATDEEESHELLTEYLDFLKDRQSLAGRELLDAGCNASRFPYDIARKYPELLVIGIDRHEPSIAAAAEKYKAPNLHYLQSDVAQLANVSARLDVITAIRALHEFPSLDETLAYIKRGLRKNGLFYFMDLNREKAQEVLNDLAAPTAHNLLLQKFEKRACEQALLHLAKKSPEHGATIIRLSSFLAAYTPQEMEDALHRAGFGEINVYKTSDEGMFLGTAWNTKTI